MGSKILLADDSITIQKVVNLTFADEGIEVVSVSNGDMAERRLQEVDPDLVLADIFMPGKNGYELCETIKLNPQFRDVPVVLLVGAFEPFNESEARRVKADAHLTKPFESRVLVETVKNLIARSPRQRSAALPPEVLQHQTAPEPPPFQNARPMAMPAIDLTAMTTPYPPQESVFADRISTSGLTDSTPFADSFPNNFDYNQHESQTPPADLEFSVEPISTSSENEAFSSAPVEQNFSTFEQTPQTPYADLFNMGSSFQTPEASPTTDNSISKGEVFERKANFDSTTGLPLGNFEVANNFEIKTEEPAIFVNHFDNQVVNTIENQTADVVADFEKLEAVEELGAPELPSFEVDMPQPLPDQGKEFQVEEVAAEVAVQGARKFDTNELDSPVEGSFTPTLSDFNETLNGNGASVDSQKSTDFAFFQESSERDPSLLSTDEPLGDVFGDFLPPDFSAQTVAAPIELEEPMVSSQELQTPETETQTGAELVAEALPAEADPFTSFASGSAPVLADEVSSQELVSELPLQDFSFVAPASQESLPVVEEVADASSSDFEVVMPPKTVPIAIETHTPTSTEFHFYSEPQEPKTPEAVAPQATGEAAAGEAVVAQDPVASQAPEQADPFIASDMWRAETQFTPISVDSVTTAELASAPAQEAGENLAEAVTPALLPLESSSPSLSASTVDVAPSKDENHLEKTTPKEVEMNKEMMDEIVRQVVSQLSDSVVREIAWEVVPDCVERVVTNLTKQDLARRL